MSRKFKFDKDPLALGADMYSKGSITINPGVTVLVGCNGSGKSTFLRIIKDNVNHDKNNRKIFVFDYDNQNDGSSVSVSEAVWNGDIKFAAVAATSSEGENISLNLGKLIDKIGECVKIHSDAEEIWIMLDAVDSGYSIDNIDMLKRLFDIILKDSRCSNMDIYIVVSANSYEMARGENCLYVAAMEYVNFSDYEEFRNFILNSFKRKEERVKKERENNEIRKELRREKRKTKKDIRHMSFEEIREQRKGKTEQDEQTTETS